MLLLRIYAPKFSFEQKKIMATELTDAMVQAFAQPNSAASEISIHFIPYQLENMAAGGRLLSETEEPLYHLDFISQSLSSAQFEALQQRLMPLLLELLGLKESEAHRITFLFHEHSIPFEGNEKNDENGQNVNGIAPLCLEQENIRV